MSSQSRDTSSPSQLRLKRPYPRPLNQPTASISRASLYPPPASKPICTPCPSPPSSSSAPPSARVVHQTKPHHPSSPQHPRMMRNRSLLQSLGPLDIPVPPSLQNSPLLSSPESVFRRPYPSTRTPGEEEERWLRDTVPMSVGSADSQIPGSSSGSLRRKDGENRNKVVSGKSPKPPPSGIGTIPTKKVQDGLLPSSSSSSVTTPGSKPLTFARASDIRYKLGPGRGEKKGD